MVFTFDIYKCICKKIMIKISDNLLIIIRYCSYTFKFDDRFLTHSNVGCVVFKYFYKKVTTAHPDV